MSGADEVQDIPMADQPAMMAALNEQRKALGLQVWELEMNSGVSASAYFWWKSTDRSPAFGSIVAIAQVIGLATVLRHQSGRQHRIISAKDAMTFINAERRARGMTFGDCERESGVSASTYWPLLRGKREPRLATMVAIAAGLDFELVLKATS